MTKVKENSVRSAACPPRRTALSTTDVSGKCHLLDADGVLVDIFFLDVMNSHEGLDSFNDPLGVSDQIMINIRRSEAMGEPMQ